MNKYDIIIIEWEDSRRADPNWQWIDEFEPQEICVCQTDRNNPLAKLNRVSESM